MFTTIAVHDPTAEQISVVGDKVGIRFGARENLDGQTVVVYLASTSHQHENQFSQTVSACDQIIEVISSVRAHALGRMAMLRPGEEIVGFISDAEKENDSEGPSDPPGWDGAGADVEAQRG